MSERTLKGYRGGGQLVTRSAVEVGRLDGYSLARAILGELEGREHGLEKDVHRLLEEDMPALGARRVPGLLVPGRLEVGIRKRASLTTTAAAAAGDMVYTSPGPFTAALRARSVALRAGATFLQGLRGKVGIRRVTGGVAVTWMSENPGADVPEVNPTVGREVLEPKTAIATISSTRQFLQLAAENPDAETLLRQDLVGAAAEAIDRAVFAGAGGTEPTGLIQRGDLPVVSIGANGGAPTYATLVELERVVGAGDGEVDPPSLGFMTTPDVRAKLRQTERAAGSGMCWEGSRVLGYPAFASSAVPSDLTKGTGTNLHALGYGSWGALVVGQWGPAPVEIVVDPFSRKGEGIVEITAFVYVDLGVLQPASLALCVDANPA